MKAFFTNQRTQKVFGILVMLLVIYGMTAGIWQLAGLPHLHK